MKRYKSVIGMVKGISQDPKFVEKLKETIKAKTVYVYENTDDPDTQVFSNLKAAKRYAASKVANIEWTYHNGYWSDEEYVHIYKKKIID